MNNFCGSPDLERSYCFKIPNAYRYYEENNYEDGVDYHNEDNIDVGNTIKMSKKCDSNWRPAGSYWDSYSFPYQTYCDYFKSECAMNPEEYNFGFMLTQAYSTSDGYTTVLNCPQCGCTDGTYDVENLFAMYTDETCLQCDYEEWTTTTTAETYTTYTTG